MAKRLWLLVLLLLSARPSFCWGFYAHQKINYYSIFLLPPNMMVFYKAHIKFITDHAVDPDKKRYLVAEEASHHFIDIDRYGNFPYTALPHDWKKAVKAYTEDTLRKYGIVPWHILNTLYQLTDAFKNKQAARILKLSASLGHYVADAHVPLHASTNHNGQLTNQQGIHAFWESRLPELFAEKEWNFFIGRAAYINNPSEFIWERVLESGAAADTVLRTEKWLSDHFAGSKWSFEERKGQLTKQYSFSYAKSYNQLLHGMIERRMRQSVLAVASLWYTAWVNAGQPDLSDLEQKNFTKEELSEFERLDKAWKDRKEEEE